MPGCSDCSVVGDDVSTSSSFKLALWIALIANLAMFFVEAIASYFSSSMSLLADSLDFFGDAANYGISLFVVGMAITARAYASLFKGITMGLFGCFILGAAVYRAFFEGLPDPMTMGGVAILALVVNVSVALLLFRYRNGDSNMVSIWLCSRNDAIGNILVLVAAFGVASSGTRWPDLLVAGAVALLSLSAAIQIIRLALSELDQNDDVGLNERQATVEIS